MSGAVVGWCYDKVITGDPIAKSILSSLAENADDAGVCHPRQELTAIKTEYSLATVKRKIKFLEKEGVIKVYRKRSGKHKTENMYLLQIRYGFDIPNGIIQKVEQFKGVRQLLQEKNIPESPVFTSLEGHPNFEGVSVTPSNENDAEGVSLTPLNSSEGHLQNLNSSQVTPLKVSPVSYKPSMEPSVTTNKIISSDEGFQFPPQAQTTIDELWRPNSYIAESLKFKFGIPEFFVVDTLYFFNLNYRGQKRRQAAFEKAFTSWVIKDWRKFNSDQSQSARPEPIDKDWFPNEKAFEMLRDEGIDRDTAAKQIPEFVMYWLDLGETRPSFSSLFVRNCIWKLQNNKLSGVTTVTVEAAPAVEGKLTRLADRSWAQ